MSAPRGHRVEVTFAGTTCSFETGRIAKLASGAVVGRSGDNVVLATVVEGASIPGRDFFPLTVEYREKLASIGRIPGSFIRREGRITDHEILVSRLIDRTVRSLFPEGYKNEVQVQAQVMSAEPTSDLASLALLSVCAALHVSGLPFRGPAAGLRVVRHRDALVPFPSQRQRAEADLDFVVSHGPDGLVMVEGEAGEASEEDCVAALAQAEEWNQKLHRAFAELRELAGAAAPAPVATATTMAVPDPVRSRLAQALTEIRKNDRHAAVAAVEQAWFAELAAEQHAEAKRALGDAKYELVRARILDEGARLDGRGLSDIRPIWGEVAWLPRAHGSAVFSRGETQALVTCTLGTGDDALRGEGLGNDSVDHFILHYNFPPYSVNEARPLRGPGRREIGHGNLAKRGLQRVMPTFADYPYTVRVESEIAESNGSSSMATVCGGCLALMDAGVPLVRPVAGIAMGMIGDGGKVAILSDILGDEDHLGDMDFKVVGTERGVTALQLDNKIGGLTRDTLAKALAQARDGRMHILREMEKVLACPRAEAPRHAPRAVRTAVMPNAIGAVVGPKGQNIRAIQAATGARIAIEDSGEVLVYAAEAYAAQQALRMVQRIAGILRTGNYYNATVTSVKDFGAFVRVNDVNEGLVPAEELIDRPGQRPSDVVQEGDSLVIRVLGADTRGRLRMSRRQAVGVDDSQVTF
ncbi:MAG: polyribonucleotide nucleotidyltransferase [Planctomycetota bacterium]